MTTPAVSPEGPIKAAAHLSFHLVRMEPGNDHWSVWIKDEAGEWSRSARWLVGHPVSEWDLDLVLGVMKDVLVDYLSSRQGFQPYLPLAPL